MQPGDKVMCVDVNWVNPWWGGKERPVLGGVYTIRHIEETERALLLREIANPHFFGGGEYGFYQSHFRKLDDIPDKVSALAAKAGTV